MTAPLTPRQVDIIRLIDDGYVSYAEIGEILDLGRTLVRTEVRVLCSRFDCPMHLLPEKTERNAA